MLRSIMLRQLERFLTAQTPDAYSQDAQNIHSAKGFSTQYDFSTSMSLISFKVEYEIP